MLIIGKPNLADSLMGIIDSDSINASLRFALGLFIYMCLIIGATIAAGAAGAYFLLIPLFGAIFYFSVVHPVKAICCFISFIFMEGMYRYLASFSPFVYALSPLAVFIQIAIFHFRGHFNVNKNKNIPLLQVYLINIVIAFMSVFNPKCIGIPQGMAALSIWYLFPMLMYPVIYYVKKQKSDFTLIILTIIVSSLLVSLVAILQYYQGEAWQTRYFPGSDNTTKLGLVQVLSEGAIKNVFRPISTGTFGGGYAAMSLVGILPSFAILYLKNIKLYVRAFCMFVMFVSMYAILQSGVRSVLLGSIIQVGFFMLLGARDIKSLSRVFIMMTVLLGLFRISYVVASNDSNGYISQRFDKLLNDPTGTFQKDRGSNISAIFEILQRNPLGIGYQRGTTGTSHEEVSENRETQFSALLLDWGVFGCLSMMILAILLFIKPLFSLRKMKKEEQIMLMIFLGWGFSHAVNWLIGPVLNANYVYWLYSGMGIYIISNRVNKFGVG